ncbi:MAG TPA: glycosyltransferase [Solirubrobacteraceae bacterium]|nr:glycosyltransferase [Solirubrobacteraceae bacterium]
MKGTIDSGADGATAPPVAVIVAAHDEADRIATTLAALGRAFPGTPLWVADDGSRDATGAIAATCGAEVVRSERVVGKGRAMTLAAERALVAHPGSGRVVFVLCDGDLGDSAALLGPLVAAVHRGDGELAVAVFARSLGGGFGLALGFAAWAIERASGLRPRAPISGQRALSRETLLEVLPFAAGYGMELGMTIDAARAGHKVVEIELDLSHRATGRTLGGFLHRGRQLFDFVRAYGRRL